MTIVYSIPRTIPGTKSLGSKCAAAAAEHEEEVGLKQNRASVIATEFYDLVGEPNTDAATAGKEAMLNQARHAELKAAQIRREAVAAGRKFNERAIDHLKAHLGRRWNPRWQGAGFTRGSLALPKDPFSLLLELRAYFSLNAEEEVASTGVTAARADELAAAISKAIMDELMAAAARGEARKARDAAFRKLRERLVGLRAELLQLLEADDMRWRTFGFARPIDRRKPKPVSEVKLRPGSAAGEVIVEWPVAVGAENYRVMRQVETVDPEPVEVGIFSDRVAILGNLPAGERVTVSVSARNPSGETAPVHASLTTDGAG
jgi:hypothetical protein